VESSKKKSSEKARKKSPNLERGGVGRGAWGTHFSNLNWSTSSNVRRKSCTSIPLRYILFLLSYSIIAIHLSPSYKNADFSIIGWSERV
jgi:hypothetical protein